MSKRNHIRPLMATKPANNEDTYDVLRRLADGDPVSAEERDAALLHFAPKKRDRRPRSPTEFLVRAVLNEDEAFAIGRPYLACLWAKDGLVVATDGKRVHWIRADWKSGLWAVDQRGERSPLNSDKDTPLPWGTVDDVIEKAERTEKRTSTPLEIDEQQYISVVSNHPIHLYRIGGLYYQKRFVDALGPVKDCRFFRADVQGRLGVKTPLGWAVILPYGYGRK